VRTMRFWNNVNR